MKDPIDLIGVHPSGATLKRPDPRDYPYLPNEVAEASIPFSWQEGDGPDPALVSLLSIKNQGQSGSCGGQAFSYYGQRLRAAYAQDGAPRSAKYLYSQVYVPGGGSSDRDLATIAKRQGFGLEDDCPSYQNGQAPSESFMERPQDITAAARIGAAKDQATMAYAFPSFDLDTVAQAIIACNGIVLGIAGSNNGTWLSTQPKPPAPGEELWYHYMHGAQPQIYNGKKGIWCPQSWGVQGVGLNGWQFLDEDYFAAQVATQYGTGAIWGAIVLIYNPAPVKPPSYNFANDLKLGASGPDVLALQQFLAYDGEFNLAPTGYYGQITAQAVLAFQLKYLVSSAATLEELGGDVVGPATRAKLNGLL